MKKIVSIFTALMLVLTAGVTAFAAPNNFVSSPSGNPAPQLVEYSNTDPDCTAKLIITAFGNRDSLDESSKDLIEKAYNTIVNCDDLTSLNDLLAKVVKDKNISVKNLAVSDLFDIGYSDCVEHDEHGNFKIKLSADTLNKFVGLMYYKDSEWVFVEDAKVDSTGNYLTFTSGYIGPYAIVVNTGDNVGADVNTNESGNNAQTGDDFSALWIVLMVVSALGLGVVAVIYVKQNRKTER